MSRRATCFLLLLIAIGAGVVWTMSGAASADNAQPSAAPAPHAAIDAIRERLFSGDAADVLIMAHRGHWRHAPENSLMAVELAIRAGVPILEIDVRTTSDGHVVVIHDKVLDRTTTGRGPVDHQTLAELKQLRLLNGYGLATEQRIPTLLEVMDLCRGRAMVYIDKSEQIMPSVIELLDGADVLDHAIFYGRAPEGRLRSVLGDALDTITYIPKVGDGTPDAARYLEPFLHMPNVPAAAFSFSAASPEIDELMAHTVRSGKRVMVAPLWDSMCAGRTDDRAVNDPDANWGWLLDRGASVFCTDRPDRLAAYLRARSAGYAAVNIEDGTPAER